MIPNQVYSRFLSGTVNFWDTFVYKSHNMRWSITNLVNIYIHGGYIYYCNIFPLESHTLVPSCVQRVKDSHTHDYSDVPNLVLWGVIRWTSHAITYETLSYIWYSELWQCELSPDLWLLLYVVVAIQHNTKVLYLFCHVCYSKSITLNHRRLYET